MEHEHERRRMVERTVASRGVTDARVLDAMRTVPREVFVPAKLREEAYADAALPIEGGQTISQPYVVAWMASALELGPEDRVLEVGAGSGYAAAVLSRIAGEVFAVERDGDLAGLAKERLRSLGYDNAAVRHGDGLEGWPEEAPFDAVAVAAGGKEVAASLVEQLAPGGRLLMPVGAGGSGGQRLVRVRKRSDGTVGEPERLGLVRFVPLVPGSVGGGEGVRAAEKGGTGS